MNVLWTVVDCLRYDALSKNGYDRNTTTPIDNRLNRDFVEFNDACAPSGFTLNVIASMLTGTYPSTHGLIRWGDEFSENIPSYMNMIADTEIEQPDAIPGMNFISDEWGLCSGFRNIHSLEKKNPNVIVIRQTQKRYEPSFSI